MKPEEKRASDALAFIIPELEKRSLRYVIVGGFACYVYGVERPMTDIDIDIDVSKDSDAFKEFYSFLTPHITQPIEHMYDQNYDNFNFEITIEGQIVDMCPMAELKIFDEKIGMYTPFYKTGFPPTETKDFFGHQIQLLPKELVLKQKEMLSWQRDQDLGDIDGLRKLLK